MTSGYPPKLRALIVDDSLVARRMVAQVVTAQPDMEVAGQAESGSAALERVALDAPDVVILDLEMPGMHGIETLKALKKLHPSLPVLIFSSQTSKGAHATVDALLSGADDYALKPSTDGSAASNWEQGQRDLLLKLRSVAARADNMAQARARSGIQASLRVGLGTLDSIKAVVIGTSVGGPEALAVMLPRLRAPSALPWFVVQHMPAGFTAALAQRLDGRCRLSVSEARHGQRVEPGTVLLAPGDFHMKLSGEHGPVSVLLDRWPLENGCRPSVNPLFRSAARVYGPGLLALVMTGMGSDGLDGARAVRDAGGHVWIQDEASATDWGMAGAISRAGLAERTIPLSALANSLEAAIAHGLPATAAATGMGAER